MTALTPSNAPRQTAPIARQGIPRDTLVVVRYGRNGEQLARYLGQRGFDTHRVQKWLRNGRTWTQPSGVIVGEWEILRIASPSDIRKSKATHPITGETL